MKRRVTGVSRREILRLMGGLAGGSALAGCGGEDVGQQEDQLIGECLWNGKAKRAKAPRGTFGGIQHVVVLMMENRSFDQTFGALSIDPDRVDGSGEPMGGEGRSDVNGLSGDELNLNLAGDEVHVFRQKKLIVGDIAHDWDNCHRQFDWEGSGIGKNDGFVREHESDLLLGAAAKCATSDYFGKNVGCPAARDPMGFYTRDELPVSYALADSYTLCDNWFSSVLGPTWPNRFYLHAGSARGQQGNKPVLGMKTIWELCGEQCLGGKNYYCDLPWAHVVGEGFVLSSKIGDGQLGGILRPFHGRQPGRGSFIDDVREDDLAPLSVIDPGFSSGYDDHPPSDVLLGQAFISYVYRILASNPKVWAKTLLVITYDEHGSFYDHVVPPGDVPDSPQSFDAHAPFRQLGIRVPALVIGPHVKQGHVSHVQYDHCSILSTVTNRFDLSQGGKRWLNDRVRHTADLADCIDVEGEQSSAEPADIPVLEFSESELMDFSRSAFPDGQEELARMVERGEIPRQHDLRGHREEHMREFLEEGEKLGVFTLRR